MQVPERRNWGVSFDVASLLSFGGTFGAYFPTESMRCFSTRTFHLCDRSMGPGHVTSKKARGTGVVPSSLCLLILPGGSVIAFFPVRHVPSRMFTGMCFWSSTLLLLRPLTQYRQISLYDVSHPGCEGRVIPVPEPSCIRNRTRWAGKVSGC
ncbi:hypothetical protein LI328DRAFT_32188 [Trichoderma asperelloides]|nr:hypothetical protein LI328DRAFT_32188 [Trichoderma asperelloides]